MTLTTLRSGSFASIQTTKISIMPKTDTKSKLQLPSKTFVATIAPSWDGSLVSCRRAIRDKTPDPTGSFGDPVLDQTPLKDSEWSTLFAYMHRRFGLPHIGGDNYKDLSAGWMLHSPDPAVFLDVSPSLNGASFSFVPRLLQSETRHTGDLDLSARRIAEIRKAYKVVLLDLLRPVCVRDSYINALGVLGDNPLDEALLAYDERNDRHVYAVEYHHTAGYAMPLGLFGGDDWPTVCALVKNLGDGDMAAGRKALIQRLQQPAINDAAQASQGPPHAPRLFVERLAANARMEKNLSEMQAKEDRRGKLPLTSRMRDTIEDMAKGSAVESEPYFSWPMWAARSSPTNSRGHPTRSMLEGLQARGLLSVDDTARTWKIKLNEAGRAMAAQLQADAKAKLEKAKKQIRKLP